MTSGPTLRPPSVVMSPRRIAGVVPTPLSFPRSAMRELVKARCKIRKLRFDLDAQGRGEVLYQLVGEGWLFHFFLISQKLDEAQKTDRNFAASWDAMGVLCQGEWTPEREAYLRREVPKQRAGFADYDTLIYARGNRSTRIFDHVVESLANGDQPDPSVIAPVGYILRTTAFIGNGQLGTRAFEGFEPDHPLRQPYHAQFCSGFMLREYVFDLVDHIARARSAHAVRLSPAWRRYLGLGNSAATGLTAFVANHPHLIHQWTLANETAIAHACHELVPPDDPRVTHFAELLDKAIEHFEEGTRPDDGVFLAPHFVAAQLKQARTMLGLYQAGELIAGRATDRPFAALCDWAGIHLQTDAQEVLQSIALEVQPDIVNRFSNAFYASEHFSIQAGMSGAHLAALVASHYRWALDGSQAEGASHYFWYRCESAPRDVRRGPRGLAPELEHETTVDTPRQIRQLHDYLLNIDPHASVADIVAARPDLRHIVARVQSLANLPYAELQIDYLGAQFSPFASIRFPLSFFGMEKLEAAPPKSVRGVFLQGAPIAEDIAAGRDGDWPFALIPKGGSACHELAPLPVEGFGAVRAPPTAASGAPHSVRLAPAELARMVQVAFQGNGASLGVAEEACQLVLMAQRAGEPAVAAALAHCSQGTSLDLGSLDLRDTALSHSNRQVLRVRGGSSLLAAAGAADFAISRAQRREDATAACLVVQARDGWLAQGLVVRCALEGWLGLLCWHSKSQDGANRNGFALAWPEASGITQIRGQIPGLARLHGALLQDAVDRAKPNGAANLAAGIDNRTDWIIGQLAPLPHHPGTTGAPASEQDEADGFALVVMRAGPALDHARLVDGLARAGVQAQHLSAQTAIERERVDLQRGLALDFNEFQALAVAGQSLLIPKSQEHRFLAPGFDPLKGF